MKFFCITLFIFTSLGINQIQAQQIVDNRPPTPRNTQQNIHTCPEGYIWQGDEWKWDKKKESYTWVAGKCTRIKRGHIWLPGRWTRVANGWTWTAGYWRKV